MNYNHSQLCFNKKCVCNNRKYKMHFNRYVYKFPRNFLSFCENKTIEHLHFMRPAILGDLLNKADIGKIKQILAIVDTLLDNYRNYGFNEKIYQSEIYSYYWQYLLLYIYACDIYFKKNIQRTCSLNANIDNCLIDSIFRVTKIRYDIDRFIKLNKRDGEFYVIHQLTDLYNRNLGIMKYHIVVYGILQDNMLVPIGSIIYQYLLSSLKP